MVDSVAQRCVLDSKGLRQAIGPLTTAAPRRRTFVDVGNDDLASTPVCIRIHAFCTEFALLCLNLAPFSVLSLLLLPDLRVKSCARIEVQAMLARCIAQANDEK